METLPHIDSAVFGACDLPSSWLRAATNRGVDARSVLQGTGLFQDDWCDPAKIITPRQLHRLFRNLCAANLGSDLPLILGARASRSQGLVGTPLWSMHCWTQGEQTWIGWKGAHADLSMHVSHAMAFATYVFETFRDLAGPGAEWTFHFKHRNASDFADAWAFLGNDLHFGQPANLICIRNSQQTTTVPANPRTFLEDVRNRLTLWPDLNLPGCARQMGISTATLKRRLATHGTSFQRQIDLLRAARAVEIATRNDYCVESAVAALGCGTPSNLRRDMRRLLGVTPHDLREAFA